MYDEVEIHIICAQILQRLVYCLFDTVVPSVVKLGCHPDVFARYARVLDALAHFGLIFVCEGGIDVAITYLQCVFDRLVDFMWLALPCSKANGGDLVTSVESKFLAIARVRFLFFTVLLSHESHGRKRTRLELTG